MKRLWVIVYHVNEYDQMDDGYFVGAFDHKPTFQDLKKMMPEQSDVTIGKLTRGGGRQGVEYLWYEMIEVNMGERYEENQ